MDVPDIQIKTRVRSVLARHWIDLNRLTFDCCRGSVRFHGEIALVEGHGGSSTASLLDTLEAEIKAVPGVKSVYFIGVTFDSDSEGERRDGLELSVSDLEITRRIRAVLKRLRIDLARLHLDCCRGSVCLRGDVVVGQGGPQLDRGRLLESLELACRDVQGVRNFYLAGVRVIDSSTGPESDSPDDGQPEGVEPPPADGETEARQTDDLELTVSQSEIKRRVHAVVSEQGLDPDLLQVDYQQGTLSFRGRVVVRENSAPHADGAAVLDPLRQKLKCIPGVRQVYFMGLRFGDEDPPDSKPHIRLVSGSR